MKMVVHCKKEPFDVYIGRDVKGLKGEGWGNPFAMKDESERGAVVEKYRRWLWAEIKAERVTLEQLAALDGKVLGCWCAPRACHGDVLVKAAAWAKKKLEERK